MAHGAGDFPPSFAPELPPQPSAYPDGPDSNGRRESRDGERRRERSRSRERKSRDDRERDRSSKSHRDRSRSRERRESSSKSTKRSPSPPKWKRRRKSLWDKAPTGLDIAIASAHAPTTGNQGRQAKRLYVGNIPPTITDVKLAEFFNENMFKSRASKDNNPTPVVAVQLNQEKGFAFIEFACPEDATAGMGFDNTMLGGNQLKIRRPKDYKAILLDEEGNPIRPSSFGQGDEGPNKIFIGGLPSYLSEDQVRELVASFGVLKSFNLVKDSGTGNSKGFAFFEYNDMDVTDRACAGLNGMKLGEKTILVQRSSVGGKYQVPKGVGDSVLSNPTALNFLNLQMPIAAAAALLDIDLNNPGSPTCVLQLINVVSPEDLNNDADFEEILEDIRDEAKKYGTIVSMYIPRPIPRERDVDGNLIPLKEPMWAVGRVFIEFRKPEEAERAMHELGGRRFAGHTVMSGYFPEDRYIRKDFMPDRNEESVSIETFKKRQIEKEFERELEQDDDTNV